MPSVFVGLGSNVAPWENLRAAAVVLTAEFGPLALSDVYRSAAIGFVGDDFLNLVARFESHAPCRDIHDRLSVLEDAAGRVRPSAGPGPRTLDLDLLLYGQQVDAALRLPAVDILAYPFVLWPLAELAPELPHPLLGVSMQAACADRMASEQGLTRLGPLPM
jgi:2-amino-4-hydroxy-6-hydroxymethyldihydropteridine diphosphokinase